MRDFVPFVDRSRYFLACNQRSNFAERHRYLNVRIRVPNKVQYIPLSSGLLSGIVSGSSGSTAIKTDDTAVGLILGTVVHQKGVRHMVVNTYLQA